MHPDCPVRVLAGDGAPRRAGRRGERRDGHEVSGGSRSVRRIGPTPQTGQRRMSTPVSCKIRSAGDGATAGGSGGAETPSSVRQRARRAARWRLASNP